MIFFFFFFFFFFLLLLLLPLLSRPPPLPVTLPYLPQVPPTLEVSGLSVDMALELLHSFPRSLGKHPEMGHEMVRHASSCAHTAIHSSSYLVASLGSL